MITPGESRLITPQPRHAVLIPTNTPADGDPREMSARAVCRWKVGLEVAAELRDKFGRANVIVAHFGGWPLHDRLPLALHHAHAAWKMGILVPNQLDLITAHGLNTVTDLGQTLQWMDLRVGRGFIGHVVTSAGHADRAVAESGMHRYFPEIHHVESGEARSSDTEDDSWTARALTVPYHQFEIGSRASDVARNGAHDARVWAEKMKDWAEANKEDWAEYWGSLARFILLLERDSVILRSDGDGCMKMHLNCF